MPTDYIYSYVTQIISINQGEIHYKPHFVKSKNMKSMNKVYLSRSTSRQSRGSRCVSSCGVTAGLQPLK